MNEIASAHLTEGDLHSVFHVCMSIIQGAASPEELEYAANYADARFNASLPLQSIVSLATGLANVLDVASKAGRN